MFRDGVVFCLIASLISVGVCGDGIEGLLRKNSPENCELVGDV